MIVEDNTGEFGNVSEALDITAGIGSSDFVYAWLAGVGLGSASWTPETAAAGIDPKVSEP